MTSPAKGGHTPTHLPWTVRGTSIYFADVAGGFDVRGCPDPVELAAFIVEACNAHATLLARCERLEAAMARCVKQFENMDENMPTDAGCIECTAGTVPNNLNTGLCGYHAARAALEVPK